jgi:hypothetical protein
MKIAYVALHLEEKFILGGVGHKIQSHRRIWQEMGHDARIFLLSPDGIDLPKVICFRYSATAAWAPLRFIQREIARSRALGQLVRAVREFQPNVIYLRYGLYAHPLQKLFNIAPVVIEINTDDTREYRHRGLFFYLLNRLTRGITLRRAAGFIPISREIAEMQSIKKFHRAIRSIPNGFDLSATPQLPAPGNPTPRLAFVGNMEAIWNGVDKLVDLAFLVPEIQIDVIGMSKEQIPLEHYPPNIRFHGLVSFLKVKEILAGADASISALALHRKPSFENSLLKVRESIAYGIPTILAYYDSDISGKNFEFVLEIPNTESNVRDHAEEIRGFIFRMVGKRVDREQIAPLIDQRKKEEQRIGFFREIVNR